VVQKGVWRVHRNIDPKFSPCLTRLTDCRCVFQSATGVGSKKAWVLTIKAEKETKGRNGMAVVGGGNNSELMDAENRGL